MNELITESENIRKELFNKMVKIKITKLSKEELQNYEIEIKVLKERLKKIELEIQKQEYDELKGKNR